jgi:hypothetical protein
MKTALKSTKYESNDDGWRERREGDRADGRWGRRMEHALLAKEM